MEKIAIFSDIHGNLEALKVILKDIKDRGIEKIISLGDTVAIGPDSNKCLELVMKNNVQMVLGNHELYCLKGTEIDNMLVVSEESHHAWINSTLTEDQFAFLNACKLELKKDINHYKFSFKHFLLNCDESDPYPFLSLDIVPKLKNKEEKVSLIDDVTFIGHEHEGFKVDIEDKKIVCVGSSGCVKDNKTFYTILTINDDNYDIKKIFLGYNRKKFVRSFLRRDYPDHEFVGKVFFGIIKK